MAEYLQAGIKVGKYRDELLEELAGKYQKSIRQIERYIARYGKNLLPQKETEELKEAKQIEHTSIVQRLVREFLDSIIYPADKESWDDLDKSRNSLWQAFKRITGDAHWPVLAAHLGDYEDAFWNMRERLEPPELAEAREKSEKIVITNYSMDDVIEIINEAYALISRSHLNLIVEKADVKEWEYGGLKRSCPD
jgi:hypothetical protein